MAEETPSPGTSDTKAAVSPTWFIGIAASAGGLEAVSLLAQNLPTDVGAVYVVAQHMSPTHKSVLASLLSRETTLPVAELKTSVAPQPDTIYVTPPNKDVVLEDGLLVLREPSGHPASPKPSGDRLFKSLTEASGERCMAIVLSGTGSDGSYGVQAIREAGGITIAQDPITAKYDGMPSSAIETGCVDLTLAPDQIGQHLTKILALPRDWDELRPIQGERNRLQDLFSIVLARTSVDFSDYKENTLNRRITRRMAALGISDYDAYVDHCRTNEAEVEALHRDLLISVTRFFRDPDQFENLNAELETKLASAKDAPIRVWIVGCATGEEAYSIAILLCELIGGLDAARLRSLQVFATDIDANAVEIARRGVYPISAVQDIPSQYLQKYFTLSDSEITVRPELRAVTLFSRHNVFQDPPFINLDLVSIRNVLIYFNQALQERVLSRLHYSLAPQGLLFLGTSETVGELSMFFEKRHGSDKIHIKRSAGGFTPPVDQSGPQGFAGAAPAGLSRRRGTPQVDTERAVYAQTSLARSVAEIGLVCTRDGKVLEFLGDVTPFIQIEAGFAKSPSLAMLAEPLRAEAQSLVAIAMRNQRRHEGRWHDMTSPGCNRAQMQAFPFSTSEGGELQCLVAINTRYDEPPSELTPELSSQEQRAYVKRIEQEVRSTREALQQTIEELQTANEELQSANEELLSTNEEFQATNEELETSNEELQSTNEELLTVNEELQVTSSERQSLATELEATLLSAPYAIVFADQALMVRRASHTAIEVFGLPDIPPSGCHISRAKVPDGFPSLASLTNDVLRLQEARVVPVRTKGLLTTLTIAPVSDNHDKPIGVSILLTQHDAAGFEQIVDLMSRSAKIGYWTYEPNNQSVHWSAEVYTLFDRDPALGPPSVDEGFSHMLPEDAQRAQDAFDTLLETGKPYEISLRLRQKTGKVVLLKSAGSPLVDHRGDVILAMGIVWDTESSPNP